MTNPPNYADDLCENPDENSSPGASETGADDHHSVDTEHQDDPTPLAGGDSSTDHGIPSPQDPGCYKL